MNNKSLASTPLMLLEPEEEPEEPLQKPEEVISEERQTQRLRWALIVLTCILVGACLDRLGTLRSERNVVLLVNGEPIRKQDFYHRLELDSGSHVLQQMAADDLNLQFAKKEGVEPDDSVVEAKYQEILKRPGVMQQLSSGIENEEDFKRNIRIGLAQSNLLTKDVGVTEEEVQQYYQRNIDKTNPKARYYIPEGITIMVIITDRRSEIRKARRALASGSNFAVVARQYSKDKSAADGGLLPSIHRGQMDSRRFPGMEAALFAMREGEQLNDLHMAGAHWLVRCVERTPARTLPLAEVKEDCILGARLAKGESLNGKTMQEAFAAFQKAAVIKSVWPKYQIQLNSH